MIVQVAGFHGHQNTCLAKGARRSDQRSPGGGTPDLIAQGRKAASKGVVEIELLVNRGAPVWLARLSRLPWQAGAARFDACQIEQTPTAPNRVAGLSWFAFNLIQIKGKPL